MSELLRTLTSLRPVLWMRAVEGRPIAFGERRITPVARSFVVGLGRPGGTLAAGWARTRPVAVLDTRQGETRRIPIPDPTRTALMAMAAAVCLVALAARYAARAKTQMRSIEQ